VPRSRKAGCALSKTFPGEVRGLLSRAVRSELCRGPLHNRMMGSAETVPRSLEIFRALMLADRVIERIAREGATTRRLRYPDGRLRVVTFLQNGVALLVLLSYIR
jgi:hypothetical protein